MIAYLTNQLRRVLSHDRVKFGLTLLFCSLYSIFRDTSYSTILKPLPIILWLTILILFKHKSSGKWVIYSLCLAILGDILLDLGDQWLSFGALPFLGSTSFLILAFHKRLHSDSPNTSWIRRILVFVLVAIPFYYLFIWLTSYSVEAARTGGVLFVLSAGLITTALNNVFFNHRERKHLIKPVMGVIGTVGIVANYVLYSIDLYVVSIPRDIVIQVYYWGTALVVWSFLESLYQDSEAIRST